MSVDLASAVRSARDALGGMGDVLGRAGAATPRFELFHAANSICSQKVRAVLAHHAVPYASHAMNMSAGHTYLPEYVRLRMIGCKQLGGSLASHHSGSTSTRAGGCDGAVVPTLVDWETAEVIVDSRRICLHIDHQVGDGTGLRPTGRAAEIDEQLDVVDDLPNYQLLMGRTPRAGGDAGKIGFGAAFSLRKVGWCDDHLRRFADDPTLVAASTAKRAKELSAAENLFSDAAMAGARSRTDCALRQLGGALERSETDWLFGNAVTMADLFWGVELLRMENLGIPAVRENRTGPRVKRYKELVEQLPAIRSAITDYPGALH